MNQPPVTLADIDAACKRASDARLTLKVRADALSQDIERAHKQRMPGIRKAIDGVAEADARVLALLKEAPHLFVKPKSITLHGLSVGYKKGAGAIEIEDPARVVERIKKNLPDKAESLIKTKETPIKAAIRALTGAELQKIGVKVHGAGEVVFLAEADDAVDKLVKALLKGADDEHQAEDAEEVEA